MSNLRKVKSDSVLCVPKRRFPWTLVRRISTPMMLLFQHQNDFGNDHHLQGRGDAPGGILLRPVLPQVLLEPEEELLQVDLEPNQDLDPLQNLIDGHIEDPPLAPEPVLPEIPEEDVVMLPVRPPSPPPLEPVVPEILEEDIVMLPARPPSPPPQPGNAAGGQFVDGNVDPNVPHQHRHPYIQERYELRRGERSRSRLRVGNVEHGEEHRRRGVRRHRPRLFEPRRGRRDDTSSSSSSE